MNLINKKIKNIAALALVAIFIFSANNTVRGYYDDPDQNNDVVIQVWNKLTAENTMTRDGRSDVIEESMSILQNAILSLPTYYLLANYGITIDFGENLQGQLENGFIPIPQIRPIPNFDTQAFSEINMGILRDISNEVYSLGFDVIYFDIIDLLEHNDLFDVFASEMAGVDKRVNGNGITPLTVVPVNLFLGPNQMGPWAPGLTGQALAGTWMTGFFGSAIQPNLRLDGVFSVTLLVQREDGMRPTLGIFNPILTYGFISSSTGILQFSGMMRLGFANENPNSVNISGSFNYLW